MPQDRYYGYQDLALVSEHVITELFSVAPSTSASVKGVGRPGIDTPPHSPTKGRDAPPPLAEFIAYALYRTRLPTAITYQALLLLSRLKARYPSARGTATSPHRLFLSSLMLSSKISMDDTYSNKSWQVVGQGLFTLREVNQMERELFAFLGWNVVVRDEELSAFVQDIIEPFKAEQAAPSPSSSTTPASTRKSRDTLKRRRDSSEPRPCLPSPAPSRSPSPSSRSSSEERHERATDAATALLGKGESSRPRRKMPNPVVAPLCVASPSSASYSTACSSSPLTEPTTPDSPSTPISLGPVTPSQEDDHELVKPAPWYESITNKKVVAPATPPHIDYGSIVAW